MDHRIAWIEDDTDVIDPVVLPLEKAGHIIDRYRSLREARKGLAQILASDLILLDVIIPDGSEEEDVRPYLGLEFLRELMDSGQKVPPVIVLSVVTNAAVIHEFNKLKVADIVRKPVLPSELRRRVEETLSRPKD